MELQDRYMVPTFKTKSGCTITASLQCGLWPFPQFTRIDMSVYSKYSQNLCNLQNTKLHLNCNLTHTLCSPKCTLLNHNQKTFLVSMQQNHEFRYIVEYSQNLCNLQNTKLHLNCNLTHTLCSHKSIPLQCFLIVIIFTIEPNMYLTTKRLKM